MKKGKRERSRDKEDRSIQKNSGREVEKREDSVNEVLVENLADTLTRKKIQEIFSVYGEIIEVNLIKQEKKAYIKYKEASSVEKAVNSISSEGSYIVKISDRTIAGLENQMCVKKEKSPVQVIDPNKHWQIYVDPTYQRNFYFNPFLNESLWELPEGGEISNIQGSNYYIPVEGDTSKPKEDNPSQDIEEKEQQSYYDEDAWDEDELSEKLLWQKMKEEQLKEWMKRPARQQVTDTRRDTAYIEGNYDYNIWYDKYLTDRKEEKEKIPAMYKCSPALDTGYTKADLQEKEGGAYFCIYFAKGCCSEGVNCRYYHRVPTKDDAEKIENLRDLFGRSRFATPLNDMGGVGTFTRECRTLLISDMKIVETKNPVKDMVRIIYENFSSWGEIEDINYIPTKAICFIRYAHRCFAEFAKEAMMRQALVGEEILSVRWAYEDPNPMNKKRLEKERENRFFYAYKQKHENLQKMKQKTGKKMLPNTEYFAYYNDINNPYAENYSGYDKRESEDNRTNEASEITRNCVKLAETFKLMENFDEKNER